MRRCPCGEPAGYEVAIRPGELGWFAEPSTTRGAWCLTCAERQVAKYNAELYR